MAITANPTVLVIGLHIYNLGIGYHAAMRSFAIYTRGGPTSADIGKMMSIIAVVEHIGTMVAGPLLNEIFRRSIGVGDPWLGTPFLAVIVIFALMTIVISRIRLTNKGVVIGDAQSQEGVNMNGAARASSVDLGLESPLIDT
jgi:hypothetical protein